jgi:hypothetical protein
MLEITTERMLAEMCHSCNIAGMNFIVKMLHLEADWLTCSEYCVI